MRYTIEEGGRLNNFAIEPKVYQAQPWTRQQKVRAALVVVGGLLLVAGLVAIAIGVS
ncbi:photosystem II assembly protein Psb34 [uncultured Thermosynechococcus sp.]|uniref:photosystem II assembly protein Psb34 n=1 Tax=uncultured Thermosynechococcus sp. TaxID=436945 RepID=UPI002638CC1B|nr:ssl1498 family light-harvesting-like protein [uncultured Thermosynechococcus sp.]